jgi:hypothetical protein
VEALDKIVALSWTLMSRPLRCEEMTILHLQALTRRIRLRFSKEADHRRYVTLALRMR